MSDERFTIRSHPMPWVEVFAVFVVSHLAGDFLLQTEWQATHKPRGLTGDPTRLRALVLHVFTYTLAFVPALIWLAGDLSPLGLAGVVAGIALPHGIQDDGRLLRAYVRKVKRIEATGGLMIAIDQSAHLLVLFGLAVAAGT